VVRDAEVRLLACLEDLLFEFHTDGEAVQDARVLRSMAASRRTTNFDLAHAVEEFSKRARREISETESGEPITLRIDAYQSASPERMGE
jgi:hypothetical protein